MFYNQYNTKIIHCFIKYNLLKWYVNRKIVLYLHRKNKKREVIWQTFINQ